MKNMQSNKSLCIIDEDDRTIGQIYTRRQALHLLSVAGGTLLLAGCAPNEEAGCVVRPALTEGPVFVDNDLDRSDIRSDPSNGNVSAGIPLALTFHVSSLASNACTPLQGAKVDIWQCDVDGIYSDTSELGMDTVGQKFLRGFQRTDDGHEFTSQLFFEEVFTDIVFAQAPYNSRGERVVRNSDDGIYEESGDQMKLDVMETADGYAATFDITLDMG